MISVIALPCTDTVARGECMHENAIDVVRLPDAANELACMRDSMTTLAGLAIRAGSDEYWKVVCLALPAPALVTQRDDDFNDLGSSADRTTASHNRKGPAD
jgi:hypothetical protein